MNNQEPLSAERGADSVQRPCSAFRADAARARELWGERSSWQRDNTGECLADRVWAGLVCSAAHAEIRGDEWSRMDQLELEAARVEYERRLRLTLAMPND